MTRVYWDTMLFAYLTEGNPEFGPTVRATRQAMLERGHRLCASMFTLCELAVLPTKRDDLAAIEALQDLFSSTALDVLPLRPDAVPHFARLRATTGVSTPDALHLAIAAAAKVDVFLTNDRRLQKLHVPGIGFIAGLDAGLY
ncbi:MAG: PIN domain-containing protein [Acidobacteria bacterium]|nr:MAG: PIN domain-containing protein [Acidobacteriota bacterium]